MLLKPDPSLLASLVKKIYCDTENIFKWLFTKCVLDFTGGADFVVTIFISITSEVMFSNVKCSVDISIVMYQLFLNT